MKKLLPILLIAPMIGIVSCQGGKETKDLTKTVETVEVEKAEVLEGSQTEINLSSYEIYLNAEKEMDSIYNKIIELYKADKGTFILNLKKSQNLWLEYFKVQMMMKYPKNISIRGGSMFALCYNAYVVELFNQRIRVLKEWLEGTPSGECCGGSIGMFYDDSLETEIYYLEEGDIGYEE